MYHVWGKVHAHTHMCVCSRFYRLAKVSLRRGWRTCDHHLHYHLLSLCRPHAVPALVLDWTECRRELCGQLHVKRTNMWHALYVTTHTHTHTHF